MKKLVITLTTLIFTTVNAQEIGLAKTNVENLPESYSEVFTKFLANTLESAEIVQKNKNYLFTIYPSISWEGKAYNICFKTYKINNLYASSCITVNYAEDIYDRLKTISNNEFFKLKNIPPQNINIKVKLDKPLTYDKVKLVSSKGDSLTRYITVSKEGNANIDLENVNVNLNIILVPEEKSGEIFKLLLENKKIEKLITTF